MKNKFLIINLLLLNISLNMHSMSQNAQTAHDLVSQAKQLAQQAQAMQNSDPAQARQFAQQSQKLQKKATLLAIREQINLNKQLTIHVTNLESQATTLIEEQEKPNQSWNKGHLLAITGGASIVIAASSFYFYKKSAHQTSNCLLKTTQ